MGRGGYLGGSTIIRSWPARSKAKGPDTPKARKGASASAASPALRAKLKPKVDPSSKARSEAKAPRHTSASVKGRGERTPPAVNAVEAAAYLLNRHPACPKANRIAIARRVGQGSWPGVTLAQAVEISMERHVTEDLCGLHRLVQSGLARPAAVKLIAPTVRAMLTLWNSKPVRLDRRAAP